jgi:hypothetical protein
MSENRYPVHLLLLLVENGRAESEGSLAGSPGWGEAVRKRWQGRAVLGLWVRLSADSRSRCRNRAGTMAKGTEGNSEELGMIRDEKCTV